MAPQSSRSVLVTGGAGYIGSHTVLQLLLEGYKAIVVDNLDNSSEISIKRVKELAGDFGPNLSFYRIDLRNKTELEKLFASTNLCFHRRLLFMVGQMRCHARRSFPLSATNPYRLTKLYIEEIYRDIYQSDSEWKIVLLRYFNTVHDYIHVMDLADGHIAALRKLSDPSIACEMYNLGTRKGKSVLEMVAAFEKAFGKKIPLITAGRRPGDAKIVYALTIEAEHGLNWNIFAGQTMA